MKNTLIMTFCCALALAGCTTFNRSALWNTPMLYDYCTYSPEQVKVGKTYVHLHDDWTEHRLSYKQELTVKAVLDENTVLLDIGWILGDSKPWQWYDSWNPNPAWIDEPELPRRPILVRTTEKHNLATNDMFSVYGQYRYVGDCVINKKRIKNFVQVNTNQVYTFEEPFIQW